MSSLKPVATAAAMAVPNEMQGYGLIGGFSGDDEIWKEIQWCQHSFMTTATPTPTIILEDRSTLEKEAEENNTSAKPFG